MMLRELIESKLVEWRTRGTKLFKLWTRRITNSSNYELVKLQTRQITISSYYKLVKLQTRQITNSSNKRTRQTTTHQITNSSNSNLTWSQGTRPQSPIRRVRLFVRQARNSTSSFVWRVRLFDEFIIQWVWFHEFVIQRVRIQWVLVFPLKIKLYFS